MTAPEVTETAWRPGGEAAYDAILALLFRPDAPEGRPAAGADAA